MACYKNGGCGSYEMYSCSECPASKPEYAQKQSTCSKKEQIHLINVDALIETVNESRRNNPHKEPKVRINHDNEHNHFLTMIATTPLIDPESLRPQGEWEFDSGVDYCYKCSECEAQRPPHYIYDNYCPNCGAKMKGAGEDG